MKRVYLDNSATTRVAPEVLEAMMPYFSEEYGNASSIHTFGQRARAAVEEARGKVADLLNADPKEIVFTSGGTESDNTAIRGVLEHPKAKGKHVITTNIEHHAVIELCKELEKYGYKVTYVPVDSDGLVDPKAIEDAITPETALISVMHANNEIGTIQPIAEIAEIARRHNVLLHTDAVQSIGKIKVDVKELGVDLLSMSGHKIHAPKGIGVLYIKKGTKLRPLLVGGPHERSRRAGTENVAAIVGLGRACELAADHIGTMQGRVRALRDKLENGILSGVPNTVLNGHKERRVPNITNISFEFVEGEGMTISLDLKGVAVSTGSACSSGALEASHVITALKRAPELAQGSIRFSLSRYTTEEEIDYTLKVVPEVVERLREMSPAYKRAAI